MYANRKQRSRSGFGSILCLEDRCVPAALGANYGDLPLSFEANLGHTDARVQFLTRAPGYDLFLTSDAAVIGWNRTSPSRDDIAGPKIRTASALIMQLVGAAESVQAIGRDPLPGTVNYILGDAATRWQTDIPTFERVEFPEVYPGIDLVYYGNQRQLEFDFVVAAGADPAWIQVDYSGADRLSLDASGNFVIEAGGQRIVQHAPVLYQNGPAGRVNVDGAFVLNGTRLSFAVGEYDASRELIIDPILSYSSYLGGSGYDAGTAIAVDSAGSAYVTGQTGTANFPTTPGSFRTALGDTNNAAFVTKLNPQGTAAVYSTYLGGGTFSHTVGYGIAVDAAGNAYVTGETSSVDFPTTPGAFQSPSIGGYDAFVTKLNPQGSGLVYSVRLGGMFDDFGRGIAVDTAGNAVVTGRVMNFAPNGPAFPTANAFQPNPGGGANDAFVTKLNATGSALVFSTYLGGGTAFINSTFDWGEGVAVDPAGNVYVTGHTYAPDFPTTPGSFMPVGGLSLDAFVTKFTPAGAVTYSTFVGSPYYHDESNAIAVDAAGNAYITGLTNAWDDPFTPVNEGFPTTPGAFQRNLAGQDDVYVAKLNSTGSALVYSTYVGGSGDFGSGGNGVDRGWGIAVDANGSAFVTGDTDSPNFPVLNAIQPAKRWDKDAFLVQLNSAGSGMVQGTFLGGDWTDMGRGVALDTNGGAYLTGSTDSLNFPTTPGAFQPANGGLSTHQTDAFVTRIATPVAPRVQSVMVNNGGMQRARVTNLTVTFDSVVNFLNGNVAAAFTLNRNGAGAVNFTASQNVIGGVTVVMLSNFTGVETEIGSLRDGRFTLTALANRISNSAGSLNGGNNYTFGDPQGLYRMFGDMNSDRRVDGFDFGSFVTTYGLNPQQTGFLPHFDFNNDSRIDGLDFGQIVQRYGTQLP